MQTIKVNKNDLINKLKENKIKHYEDYQKAVLGYKVLAQKVLKEKLKKLKYLDPYDLKDFDLSFFNIVKPESHLDDFDIAIGMLELSVDVNIDISTQEYRQYYLNEWSWIKSWELSNVNNFSVYEKTYVDSPLPIITK